MPTITPWCWGRPTIERKTAYRASSPAKLALHMPEPAVNQQQQYHHPWQTGCHVHLRPRRCSQGERPVLAGADAVSRGHPVEITKRFKGLDLIDKCLKNYGQRFITLYKRKQSKPSPRKRNAKRQNGCLRRPYK